MTPHRGIDGIATTPQDLNTCRCRIWMRHADQPVCVVLHGIASLPAHADCLSSLCSIVPEMHYGWNPVLFCQGADTRGVVVYGKIHLVSSCGERWPLAGSGSGQDGRARAVLYWHRACERDIDSVDGTMYARREIMRLAGRVALVLARSRALARRLRWLMDVRGRVWW